MSDAGSSGRRAPCISAVAGGGGDSGSGSRSPRSREDAGLLLALPGGKSPKLRRTGEAVTFAAAAPAPVREVSHVRYVARGEAVVPCACARCAGRSLVPRCYPPLPRPSQVGCAAAGGRARRRAARTRGRARRGELVIHR
jgi:hypothetical protein